MEAGIGIGGDGTNGARTDGMYDAAGIKFKAEMTDT